MITGPFWPRAPWWICAAAPCTPVVVTLPVTVPSPRIVKLPLPEPGTEMGGTSSAPLRLTLTVLPPDIMPAQAASDSDARTKSSFFMGILLCGDDTGGNTGTRQIFPQSGAALI